MRSYTFIDYNIIGAVLQELTTHRTDNTVAKPICFLAFLVILLT